MRKNYLIILVVAISILCGSEMLHAQWINNGPYNASVSGFAVSSNGAGGSDIFALTGSGVYISTDNGANWTAANNGFPVYGSVGSLAALGTKVYAGFNDYSGPDQNESGVYATTNNGKNWTPANGLPAGGYVQTISAFGSSIYAAIDTEVYYSPDNGVSWTYGNNGLDGNVPIEFGYSGLNVFALTFGGNLYKSIDNGKNWAAVNSGLLLNNSISAIAVSDTDIFAANDYAEFYRSTDNGSTWTFEGSIGSLPSNYINTLVISGNKLLAGTNQYGIYLSSDKGATWVKADSGIVVNTSVYGFAFSGSNIFAGTDDGISLSSDQAKSWNYAVSGMTDISVEALAVSGQNIFAATGTGVFHSSDDGKTWSGVNNRLPNYPYNTIAVSGNTVFAGAFFNGIFRSTDNGSSWAAQRKLTLCPHQCACC